MIIQSMIIWALIGVISVFLGCALSKEDLTLSEILFGCLVGPIALIVLIACIITDKAYNRTVIRFSRHNRKGKLND